MNIIRAIEKKLRYCTIPHLTVYLLLLQIIGVILLMNGTTQESDLILSGNLVQLGEWKRLGTFMLLPIRQSYGIFLFVILYLFYKIGDLLEREWGAFQYNLFIWSGYFLTLIAAFILPHSIISNHFFLGSIFLALATLIPETKFYLFFVLPLKAKWIGFLTVGFFIYIFLQGYSGDQIAIAAVFINYGIFFRKKIRSVIKTSLRRKQFKTKLTTNINKPLNQCTTCKRTDKTDPTLTFRYCSECGECFCEEHMKEHSHI